MPTHYTHAELERQRKGRNVREDILKARGITTTPSPTEVRSEAQPSKGETDTLRSAFEAAKRTGNINAAETQAKAFGQVSLPQKMFRKPEIFMTT
jgi:hypothetical protein